MATTVTMKRFVKWLESKGACEEAVQWVAKQKSPRQALAKCKRLDWLEWLAYQWPVGSEPRDRLTRLESGLHEFFRNGEEKKWDAMLIEGIKRIYTWDEVKRRILSE